MRKFGRIALKTILWIIGLVIVLVISIIILIRIPAVQNFVVGKVTNYLEGKIGTPVDIGYINITFPKKLVLENIYFEDQSKDTLVAGEKLLVDINMWKLLKNTIEVKELELKGVTAKINRTLPDSAFNFDYIIQAFASEEKKEPEVETESTMIFDLDKVLLERIRFVYQDDVIGTSADVNLNHFNTRIKKFDLKNNMAFDMPTITIDGLQAAIKQWKVAQVDDAPDASDFGITDASVEESSLLPDLGINKLDLKNILVKYNDESSGMDTRFDIKKLLANIQEFDLNKEIVKLKDITLDESDSYVLLGKTIQPSNKDPKENLAESDTTQGVNWVVTTDKLNINNTKFWFKDENQARTKGLDYFNLRLTDFVGDLENLYYSSDSISGSLKHLTVKDHSGFLLKELKADFVYNNTGALIENLHAETPKTLIRDYIRVSYPSLEAISNDLSSMTIDANIKKSHIDMSDLKFFAPDLEKEEVMKPLMATKFFIDGRVTGRVNDLHIPSLEFKTLDNTHIIAKAHIKGLPETDKLYIDLNLNKFTTGRRDIERLVAKSMLPDSIQLPSSISLTGKFKGGMSGFDTDLNLITEQGSASVNGNMVMGRDTTYNMQVTVNDLNIGKILNQDSVLGIVAVEAKVKGTGINPKTMIADINGKVNRLDAMGYSYQNISMDLTANNGAIAGNISSPDPNVQFNMDMTADMTGQYPKLSAEMMIDSINFQNLKLMNDNFRYHGRIVADFETLDLDHLNGSLKVVNSHLAHNDERFILDTIALSARADSNSNMILFDSDFLDAHLVGNYKISELGTSIQDIVKIYYNPAGNHDTTAQYEPQQFEFSARLTHSKFIRDFVPDLLEMSDITLDGTFNSESKQLMAKLLAPRVNYNGTLVENIGVDIITVDSTMYYNALINKIKMGNIEMINTVFSGSVIENNLDFGLWIRDRQNKEQYHLGAKMNVTENNFILSMFEDGLMLNYDTWHIDPSNQISFGADGIKANGFRLSNNGQELVIQSQDSTLNSPIDLSFNNFRIETFSKILDSEVLDFAGGINGTATISRLESNPVFVSDLTIDDFTFGKQLVGDILVKVNNEKENTFSADVRITGNGNDVQLIGDFISPPNENARIEANLELKPMQMSTLQAFSLGNLQDCSGQLTGKLAISGTTSAPRIKGGLTFNDAVLNVSMLNATMRMNNQTINFNDQGIQFRQFQIQDTRNNIARLNGTVKTTTYTDFDFNLNLTMDDFEAMNSSIEDNDLFYGKMYLTSNLRITGDLNKPRVSGNVKANDKTDFYFVVPNENPGVAERDGVVKFVNRGDSTRTNIFAKLDSMTNVSQLSGIDLALNLQTDPNALFTIVLDPGTQDEMHIQGVAELTTTIDASEKITMSGVFTVEKGEYTFPLGPIKKKFTFQKGSTITWLGDPLDANVNITAVYRERFPTLELVQSTIGGQNQNLYKQRIPFNIKLILTGALFTPDLKFDIELDENAAVVPQEVTNNVNIALSNMRNDPAEMNKQVFSAIALGRFMASNPFESLSGGGGTEALVRNTLSSFLSGQLNNLASSLIKGVELDFNLQSEQDYLTGNAQTRTDLNIGISKMMFDDRLKVTVGSNFEVEGNTRPGEKSSNIAGDVSLEYQLSKDGRYFARVYRKNQYQATLQGQFVETGIGFIINMSYDRFKELFMSSRALEQYYNTESRGFRRRFDVERMETDSVYRDSVRLVIRDSLMQHSPEYRKRIEEEEKQEQLQQGQDSTKSERPEDKGTRKEEDTAIRNEEDERDSNEN